MFRLRFPPHLILNATNAEIKFLNNPVYSAALITGNTNDRQLDVFTSIKLIKSPWFGYSSGLYQRSAMVTFQLKTTHATINEKKKGLENRSLKFLRNSFIDSIIINEERGV
jgi:hypothetical protein